VTGTYNLSQVGPEGYTLDSLTCSNSGNNQVSSVTLGLGENVTCTFVNDDNAPSQKPVSTYRKYAYTNPGITPGYSKSVNAYCDEGDVATGGSTYISPSAGETLYDFPLSRYDATLRKYVPVGWAAYFRNTHATASTYGYVYLVCMDVSESPKGLTTYREYSRSEPVISPGYSKSVYGYCDEGDVITGGSTYISPNLGKTLYDVPISRYDSAIRKYIPSGWGSYFRNTHSSSSTYGYVYYSCLDTSGKPGISTYRRYAYTNPAISPGYSKAVYAYCDEGDVATGGSTYISSNYGEALYDYPRTRYDATLGKYVPVGWAGYFRNTHATSTATGYVYLVCADNTP
jgi:hypothetical protein